MWKQAPISISCSPAWERRGAATAGCGALARDRKGRGQVLTWSESVKKVRICCLLSECAALELSEKSVKAPRAVCEASSNPIKVWDQFLKIANFWLVPVETEFYVAVVVWVFPAFIHPYLEWAQIFLFVLFKYAHTRASTDNLFQLLQAWLSVLLKIKLISWLRKSRWATPPILHPRPHQ